MKVTEEMESAFIDAAHGDGSQVTEDVCAGLSAVLRVIDPVPAEVDVITDRNGDEWYRCTSSGDDGDPMVWYHGHGAFWHCGFPWSERLIGTMAWIQREFGPITWRRDGF